MEASEDPRIVYADILYHPHHQSEKRAHMPLADRAAQFSAYDALAGFFDMIDEEERFTEAETELDENARELLDRKLQRIAEAIRRGEQPRVCFTVFVPDERKAGGSYREITESVFSEAPLLGGIVDIVYGERPTTCPSVVSCTSSSTP